MGARSWGSYAQIADALRARLADAEPGAALPSEGALAAEFGAARNTVRRALARLEGEGLVVAVTGRGRVVAQAGVRPVAGYRVIAADLRRRIEGGELAAGQRLPSESELAQRYEVSRGTARQGLALLEAAGLVTAVQGKGRFVNNPGRSRDAQAPAAG